MTAFRQDILETSVAIDPAALESVRKRLLASGAADLIPMVTGEES